MPEIQKDLKGDMPQKSTETLPVTKTRAIRATKYIIWYRTITQSITQRLYCP